MVGRIILKWLKVNWGIKILSLFIALLVWWHVRTERTYEVSFSLPLCLRNLPSQISFVEEPPESVKVVIQGKGKDLVRLRWGRSLEAVYDLSNATSGWKRIDLSKDNIKLPYWSKSSIIEGPFPRTFIVHLEKKKRISKSE
jgi:YbbR domain-containing protein